MTHSILAPSSAARRRQCPGSTQAEAARPQDSGPAAIEGTTAHWGASEMLAGRAIAEGQVTPTGQYLTAEMIEGAGLYYDALAAMLEPYGLTPADGQIEQPLRVPRVHPESWGTADFRIWLPQSKRVLVADYKFGFRPVEAFENLQCIEYAAGALDELRYDWNDPSWLVTIVVVQPRAPHRSGPVREWTTRAVDLRGQIQKSSDAAREALSPNPTFRVGPECRDCRARHACPTLLLAALSACDSASQEQPFDLPAGAAALEYRTLKRQSMLLEARISGIEEQLLSLARSGTPLPGLRVEHGAGREQWTIPDADVIAMGQMLGVPLAKPAAPITPKQAIKAGLPPAALAGLVNTPRGAAKLVEDDGTLARRVFHV